MYASAIWLAVRSSLGLFMDDSDAATTSGSPCPARSAKPTLRLQRPARCRASCSLNAEIDLASQSRVGNPNPLILAGPHRPRNQMKGECSPSIPRVDRGHVSAAAARDCKRPVSTNQGVVAGSQGKTVCSDQSALAIVAASA